MKCSRSFFFLQDSNPTKAKTGIFLASVNSMLNILYQTLQQAKVRCIMIKLIYYLNFLQDTKDIKKIDFLQLAFHSTASSAVILEYGRFFSITNSSTVTPKCKIAF